MLSAEVSGAIVEISPKFIAGGLFRAGETLMRIDPSNYSVAVDQANATLTQRQIEFDGAEKLRSQGYRAESEYASAAAALAAAKAEVVRARRNLERTQISLPYDGMVRAKEADIGQYVNPGTRLGVTFCHRCSRSAPAVDGSGSAFVSLPSASELQSEIDVNGPLVELSAIRRGRPTTWAARIVRTEGVVDETNRVTYAVARIADPYNLAASGNESASLPMGTFVAAKIEGNTVDSILRVPRLALRGNNQLIFVDDEDRVRIRNVDVFPRRRRVCIPSRRRVAWRSNYLNNHRDTIEWHAGAR